MAVRSPEDVCNMALDWIGYDQSIASLYGGTKVERIGVRLYGQTRDAVLREKDWTFAVRFAAAVTNGQTPQPPWLFEYGYPSDCLRVRQIIAAAPGTNPVWDPRPQQFTDFDEVDTAPESKAILANISPATIVYTGRILNPLIWDAGYIDALVAALARRFTIALNGNPQMVSAGEQLSEEAISAALGSQVNLPPSPVIMARAK